MRLLVCIDDTDDLESKGTGEIAEELCGIVNEKRFGTTSSVSRHQLFVDDRIPYTSHNSSMCFEVNLHQSDYYNDMLYAFEEHLKYEKADTSDPGLCICDITKIDIQTVINYGKRTKVEVITKSEAYKLAKEQEIFLNEYGGTGDGIIGALAGIGLRLSGHDGRFKGKHKIVDGYYTVEELKTQLKIDEVMLHETSNILEEGRVYVSGKVKSVLMFHKRVLPVFQTEAGYANCKKEQLRRY